MIEFGMWSARTRKTEQSLGPVCGSLLLEYSCFKASLFRVLRFGWSVRQYSNTAHVWFIFSNIDIVLVDTECGMIVSAQNCTLVERRFYNHYVCPHVLKFSEQMKIRWLALEAKANNIDNMDTCVRSVVKSEHDGCPEVEEATLHSHRTVSHRALRISPGNRIARVIHALRRRKVVDF